MIDEFRLEDVNKSPAFFDITKLAAFNGEYLRALSVDEYVQRFETWLASVSAVRFPWNEFGTTEIPLERLGEGRQQPPILPWDPQRYDREIFQQLVPIIQERAKLLSDVPALVEFAFVDEPPFDPASWDKTMGPGKGAKEMLDGVLNEIDSISFTHDALKELAERVGEANGMKLGKAQAPLRVAVTGRTVGPPLFEALVVLGHEKTAQRFRVAREKLG
jgi:glutamyl-tRNA synthetase